MKPWQAVLGFFVCLVFAWGAPPLVALAYGFPVRQNGDLVTASIVLAFVLFFVWGVVCVHEVK